MTLPSSSRGGGPGTGMLRKAFNPTDDNEKIVGQRNLLALWPGGGIAMPCENIVRCADLELDVSMGCMPLDLQITGRSRHNLRLGSVLTTYGLKQPQCIGCVPEAHRLATVTVPPSGKLDQIIKAG